MELKFKNIKEAQSILFNILNQGDSRYDDPREELILANFLLNGAISLEKRWVENVNNSESKVRGVQKNEKNFAKGILKKEGFLEEEIFLERMFNGSRVDVLAETNNKIILVECCSCRVDKIRNFLTKPNTEVWVIIRDEFSEIYLFKRGLNWHLVKDFEEKRLQELKKIKSPFDSL